ncbi:uncharacterized protein [Antedon mediterranea]|uniref:uncharacterized protein n=1 Tax=Antedon mediterranea TaxID=105859 RepID=UPI003AF5169E
MADADEPNVRAEPVPEWETATVTWDWAWELHTFGIGACFFLLGIYCIYTTHLLIKYNKGKLKSFFIAVNVLVFLLCLMRTIFLMVDPYRSREIFSELGAQILFNVSFPCLTSGFSLVNWAFLESSKFKLLSPKLQNSRILVGIIIGHFTFVLTADFLVAFVGNTWILVMLCQGTFIIWGMVLCVGFSYSAWKVYNVKRQNRKTLYKINSSYDGVCGRFKFRKSKQASNKNKQNSTVPAVVSATDTEQKKFSLPVNGNITDTYNNLTEEAIKVSISHDQQSPIADQKLSVTDTEVFIKTDLEPNNIIDANGTRYTVRSDSENSHIDDVFDGESITDNETRVQQNSNQSTHLEIDVVSLAVSTDALSTSNGRVYTTRASRFLTSIKGNRFLRKKQYGVKSIKGMSIINKKTSLITKMIRITMATTTFAAIICLISTYAMFGVFSVLAEDKQLEPWGWYSFQTVMRLCELGMGITMAYLTTTPPSVRNSNSQRLSTSRNY